MGRNHGRFPRQSRPRNENSAQLGSEDYNSFDYCRQRKNLLPLEESLMALRKWRNRWQQARPMDAPVARK